MRAYKILLIVLLFFATAVSLQAAELYFVGAANANWNNSNHWSYTVNGSSAGVTPGTADTVYLAKSITVNDTVEIKNLVLSGTSFIDISGTGRIEITGDLTATNTNSTALVGDVPLVFTGTGNQTIQGSSTGVGGSITSLIVDKASGTLFLKDKIRISDDFQQINGTVDALTQGSEVSIIHSAQLHGNITLDTLIVGGVHTVDVEIDSIANIVVQNLFKINLNAAVNFIGNGAIHIKGDFKSVNNANYTSGNGSVTMLIDGTGNQIFSGLATNVTYKGFTQQVVINKPSGTLFFKDYINMRGGIELINGQIDVSTYNSTVSLYLSSALKGDLTFDNLRIGGQFVLTTTIDSNSTIEVLGSLLTHLNAPVLIEGEGAIHVKGDFGSIGNARYTSGKGNVPIIFNGTGDQLFYGRTTDRAYAAFVPNMIINKPSGKLVLKDWINMWGGIEHLSGDIDYTTHTSYVSFYGTATLAGLLKFDKMIVGGQHTVNLTLDSNAIVNVFNKLSTARNASVNVHGEGKLQLHGDLSIANGSKYGGTGTAPLYVVGDGSQELKGRSTVNKGYLQSVIINKTSGDVTLKDKISLKGDWIVENGQVSVDNSSTLAFRGTNTIKPGNQDVYNTISQYHTRTTFELDLQNDLSINTSLVLNNSKLSLNGFDLTINNTDPNAIVLPTSSDKARINNNEQDLENEVRWRIDESTNQYDFPFYNGITSVPTFLKLSIDTPGVLGPDSTGYVIVSSYNTDAANSSIPQGINTMLNAGGTDNAYNVADRYWKVSFEGFTTDPVASAELDYGVGGISPPNTMTPEANIAPQYYDGGWVNESNFTIDQTANTVTISPLKAHDFIILSNNTNPVTDDLKSLEVSANVHHIGFNNDSSGIIDLSVQGGVGPYSYEWSDNSTLSSLGSLPAGAYSVTILDSIGDSLETSFNIEYQIMANIGEQYVLNTNGHLTKNPTAIYSDELISASNYIAKNAQGWTEASFGADSSGTDSLNFYFGLDYTEENVKGEDLDYGIKCKNGELFVITKGTIVKSVGSYKAGEPILIASNSENINVYKSGELLTTIQNYKTGILTPKMALAHSTILNKWSMNKFWNPTGETGYYATLSKKLDAGYYVMTNDIKFKYKEKYNDSDISYNIYDWKRDVQMADIQPEDGHKYGVNYYTIANAYDHLMDNEFYVMEVSNNKNEVYKMRFKFEKQGSMGIGPFYPPNYPGPIIMADSCCYPLLNSKCCSSGINPPVVVNPNTGVVEGGVDNNFNHKF